MFYIVEEAVRAILVTGQLIKMLEERVDEQWRCPITLYIQEEQKQYSIWEYIYFLTSGKPYDRSLKVKHEAKTTEELVLLLCFYELQKASIYRKLSEILSGAQKYAAEQALAQALKNSRFLWQLRRVVKGQAAL
ncbi:hypothetical protein [Anoxybacteroides tepidamans]|uniref:hypothetical protein n=1 Tax=Anoxybacteroides tepidamans TaxID=265948 RepID=UPI00048380CF|nr:hypothetical protein [Anoxybacillus tepidamans]